MLFRSRKLSRDEYLFVVSCILSSVGLIHGFIVTQSTYLYDSDFFIHSSKPRESLLFGGRQHSVSGSELLLNFISTFYFGEVCGALISSPFNDGFGRRAALLMASCACSLFLVLYALSDSLSFNVVKFSLGMTVGAMFTSSIIYIAEITPNRQRGRFLGLVALMTALGSLSAALIQGVMLHLLPESFSIAWQDTIWRVSVLIIPGISVLIECATLCFIPETPRWLLGKKTPTGKFPFFVLKKVINTKHFNNIN